jgi:hypothetical protein
MEFSTQDRQKVFNIIREFLSTKPEAITDIIDDYVAALTVTWIPVTYINSWVDYSIFYISSSYYKDIFGNVHLIIACKDGSTANPFILPIGYRPTKTISFPLDSVSSSTTVPADISINSSGIVTFYSYTNTYCINSEIIYKAA